MQKRSLVFIFILTFSLLIVNMFFKPDSKKAQSAGNKTEIVAKNTLETRVATQAGLPLVDLYKDEGGKTYLTSGLLFNGNILTLKWDEKLPEDVYFKKSHSSFPVEKASIIQSEASLKDPVLYKSNHAKNLLESAELPSKGSIEIQLIHTKAYNNNPQIFTSYFSNGNFASIGQIEGNAIAVALSQTGYEPVGVYLGNEGKLIPLKDFFNLKSLISSHRAHFQTSTSNEQFYILENNQQQLVFSNIGGALAEINLPIKSDQNTDSQVYSTSQDDKFAEQKSKHSLFPAHPYSVATDSKGSHSKDMDPSRGGYYPFLRRSIEDHQTKPRYYAFNLVSDFPGLSEQPYKVVHFDKEKIVFEANQNYRKITKTFTLDNSKPYGLNVDIKVEGDHQNLWVTTGVPEAEFSSNVQQPVLKYRHQKSNKFETAKLKLPKGTSEVQDVSPAWISNSNGFFTMLVDPQTPLKNGFKVNKIDGLSLSSRIDQDTTSKAKKSAGYEFLLPLAEADNTHFNVYTGPLENNLLLKAQGDNAQAHYLGAQSYHGFLTFISEPCAKILFVIMNLMHKMTGSWGLSIILLTVALRFLLYPLNSWSINAMRKNQEIAPEVAAINKKYKSNPKQAQIEIMTLYRKRKVNPLTGCLPMLIQMPFLMGMFNLLRSAFVLRGVPFIPGWIDNLTAPDVLFTWTKAIPFFGNEFHLLPIISCIVIWVQQKMTNAGPTDKSLMTAQQKQQKMMANMMVVFVTFICYNLPSGLNLYWIFSSLLGILQQWITNRLLDKKKNKPIILGKSKTALKEKQV